MSDEIVLTTICERVYERESILLNVLGETAYKNLETFTLYTIKAVYPDGSSIYYLGSTNEKWKTLRLQQQLHPEIILNEKGSRNYSNSPGCRDGKGYQALHLSDAMTDGAELSLIGLWNTRGTDLYKDIAEFYDQGTREVLNRKGVKTYGF